MEEVPDGLYSFIVANVEKFIQRDREYRYKHTCNQYKRTHNLVLMPCRYTRDGGSCERLCFVSMVVQVLLTVPRSEFCDAS